MRYVNREGKYALTYPLSDSNDIPQGHVPKYM